MTKQRLSLLACGLALATLGYGFAPRTPSPEKPEAMKLGVFSLSLSVKDIQASKAFYEKLDFHEVGGNIEQNWIVLQNDTTTIGLFQGMFEGNMMTFNPGWNHKKESLKEFVDVREIQKSVKESGIMPVQAADETTSGPASMVIVDPDGNMILFDQHV
ncbi:MAG: lactoylglutathione lyase [Planctomycetota bacterium]|jgi:lactoylglutathione lyase